MDRNEIKEVMVFTIAATVLGVEGITVPQDVVEKVADNLADVYLDLSAIVDEYEDEDEDCCNCDCEDCDDEDEDEEEEDDILTFADRANILNFLLTGIH